MLQVSIDGIAREAQPDELPVDLINRTGGSIPQVCYHPSVFSGLSSRNGSRLSPKA
ncbi:MAG TPA: hypothetical protein VN901_04255 [Candidatus Acidoferrales bacterium]|nr:hypothetical protein [Candidatus Acidoferrales bacterium]